MVELHHDAFDGRGAVLRLVSAKVPRVCGLRGVRLEHASSWSISTGQRTVDKMKLEDFQKELTGSLFSISLRDAASAFKDLAQRIQALEKQVAALTKASKVKAK